MQFSKSKKAMYTADSTPFYIVFSIVVVFLFLIFVFVVNHYSVESAKTPEGLETYLLTQRFLRSPDCFLYEGISGRTYPLTFSWGKFTQNNLNKCYNPLDEIDSPAFRLSLSFQSQNKNIQTTNWDNSLGPEKINSPTQVFVYYNNQKHIGQLTIGIQNE